MFEFFRAVIPAKAGIQVSLFFKDNGFPTTTSGMTTGMDFLKSGYVKGFMSH